MGDALGSRHHGRCLLDHLHKPHLGDQDAADVASIVDSFTLPQGLTIPLQQHFRRGAKNVSTRGDTVLLLRSRPRPPRTNTCGCTISGLRVPEGKIHRRSAIGEARTGRPDKLRRNSRRQLSQQDLRELRHIPTRSPSHAATDATDTERPCGEDRGEEGELLS